jgi:MtN3 and saliva related transmembrane protein
MSTLSILAIIFGAIGGLANLPQALKIFKRKSAKDISILTYAFLLTGAIIWVFYGIKLRNIAVIITNMFGATNIGLVILGWFLYGRTIEKEAHTIGLNSKGLNTTAPHDYELS